uniref:Uncharacterized protein n=1 Tax=Aegilops tauschii subsp. strangulata TaxID=200361 RepID=A0A453D0R4_AEGTS
PVAADGSYGLRLRPLIRRHSFAGLAEVEVKHIYRFNQVLEIARLFAHLSEGDGIIVMLSTLALHSESFSGPDHAQEYFPVFS